MSKKNTVKLDKEENLGELENKLRTVAPINTSGKGGNILKEIAENKLTPEELIGGEGDEEELADQDEEDELEEEEEEIETKVEPVKEEKPEPAKPTKKKFTPQEEAQLMKRYLKAKIKLEAFSDMRLMGLVTVPDKIEDILYERLQAEMEASTLARTLFQNDILEIIEKDKNDSKDSIGRTA